MCEALFGYTFCGGESAWRLMHTLVMSNDGGGSGIPGAGLNIHDVMADYTGVLLLFERVFALLASRGGLFCIFDTLSIFYPPVLFARLDTRAFYYLFPTSEAAGGR